MFRILISTVSSMEKSRLHRVLVSTSNTGFLSLDINTRARTIYQGESMSRVRSKMSTRMMLSVTIKQRLLMGYKKELMWSMGGSLINQVYCSFVNSLSRSFGG